MKHRIGLIGLGMAITPHAKSLLDLDDRVEVAWAHSRSQARCDAFAEKFPFPTTTELDRIFDDPTIDTVAIVTPPDSHLDLVRRAAATGKHVLLEKPIELDTARAELTVDAARDAGITLAMVLQFRFRAASQALASAIADGTLGEIAAATVTAPWWRPQSYYDEPGRGTLARDGGGVLITQAIHVLDLFQSLVGGVATVSAVAAKTAVHDMECEDFAAAALALGNGAPGNMIATTALYPGFSETITIIGTAATAVLSGEMLHIHHRDGSVDEIGSVAKSGGGADPMDFPHDAHRGAMKDFLDALDEGRAPLASGAEALKVHRLIDAILASARTGKRVALDT